MSLPGNRKNRIQSNSTNVLLHTLPKITSLFSWSVRFSHNVLQGVSMNTERSSLYGFLRVVYISITLRYLEKYKSGRDKLSSICDQTATPILFSNLLNGCHKYIFIILNRFDYPFHQRRIYCIVRSCIPTSKWKVEIAVCETVNFVVFIFYNWITLSDWIWLQESLISRCARCWNQINSMPTQM